MLRDAGFLGKHRNLRKGLIELKIDAGAAYRIYLGQKEKKFIVLLCGGDKSSQQEDIRRAEKYWTECEGSKWKKLVRTLIPGWFKI